MTQRPFRIAVYGALSARAADRIGRLVVAGLNVELVFIDKAVPQQTQITHVFVDELPTPSTFSIKPVEEAAPLLRLDGRSDRDRTQGYARDARHASKAHEQRARQLLARRR